MYIHTCMHTCIHTYIHTYIHNYLGFPLRCIRGVLEKAARENRLSRRLPWKTKQGKTCCFIEERENTTREDRLSRRLPWKTKRSRALPHASRGRCFNPAGSASRTARAGGVRGLMADPVLFKVSKCHLEKQKEPCCRKSSPCYQRCALFGTHS